MKREGSGVPVFPMVVGCGRSGTTLLRAMLDSHSELAMSPEANWAALDRRWGRAWHRPAGFDFLAVGAVIDLVSRSFEGWGFDLDAVQERMAEVRPETYPDYVRSLNMLFAERAGKVRWGDKSPRAAFDLPALATMFPEARFVHLVRDGRDVARSFLAASFGPSTAVEGAAVWRRAVRAGRRGGQQVGAARYLEVFYADLVARPEEQLRRICDHFDLEFEARMLDYHLDGDRYASRPEHVNLRLPPRSDLERVPLGPRDRELVEAVAGRQLVEFGFAAGGPVRRRTRIAATSALVRHRCRDASRSVRRRLWTERRIQQLRRAGWARGQITDR